jgi:uncharacterized protein YndB with AHSA1/START domain
VLYRAFIDPVALASWLPPRGMAGKVSAFDLRVGGRFDMTLTYQDHSSETAGKTSRDTDVVRGTFVELVPDERIVWRAEFDSADPAFAGTMVISWTFRPVDGGTEVSVRCDDMPEGIRPENHQVGLNSSLENLAVFAEATDS